MGWWFLYGGVSMAAFWALLIGVVVWVGPRFTCRNSGNMDRDESPPDEIGRASGRERL